MVTKYLVMGALAIGMTSVAIASEDHESASKNKQLCFQINGDINNSSQIDKIYLTVNSVGVATSNGCFYSIADPSATTSCSPVVGNVTGKYPEVFLSLTGNWQRTIGSEDTRVSVRYDFKNLSGEGIAKTVKTDDSKQPQEINSSEGSVSRIDCPKLIVNPINHLPPIPALPVIVTPTPLTAATTAPIYCSSYLSTAQYNCSNYTSSGQATCNSLQQPNGINVNTQTSGGKLCSWNANSTCVTSATSCT